LAVCSLQNTREMLDVCRICGLKTRREESVVRHRRVYNTKVHYYEILNMENLVLRMGTILK